MGTRINVQQGSPDWLVWREGKKTASQAPIAMKCAPSYWATRSWDDLRAVQAGINPPVSPRLQQIFDLGHAGEKVARAILEKKYCSTFQPACFQEGSYAASLDGIGPVWDVKHNANIPAWIEIKTITRSDSVLVRHIMANKHEAEYRNRVPPYIWWQLVHQEFCLSGSGYPEDRKCVLAVYGDMVYDGLLCVEIPRHALQADVKHLISQWERFDEGADHGWDKARFSQAAMRWRKCRASYDNAREELAKAQKDLLEMMNVGESITGAGIKVNWRETIGAVKWQNLARSLWAEAVAAGIRNDELDELANRFRAEDKKGWVVEQENNPPN